MTTSQRGYTLLELIVSVGIFSLVMLAATGAFLQLISLDKQARATNDIVTNLSFAVDTMSRTVRTGTNYRCNDSSGSPNCLDIGTPGTSFGFTDSEAPARAIVYSLASGQIVEDITVGGVTSRAAITDPRITIQALNFYVRGVGIESGTKIQPQVTFVIRGTMKIGEGKTVDFTIEGGGTERLLEL